MERFFSRRDSVRRFGIAREGALPFLRIMAVLAVAVLSLFRTGDQIFAGSDLSLFHVSQAVSRYPVVDLYLDAVDGAGNPLPLPPAGSLSVLAGRQRLPVSSLDRFSECGQGVAYIFVVDVSRSLGESELAGMRDAIASWVQSCGEKDRFALMTFGTEVSVRADFTGDRDLFLSRVADLHPTDMLTGLHAALIQAQGLGDRRDPDLPRRRAVIVLSDGKNEALYGETAREVSKRLQESPVPIFALGFFQPPYGNREESLRQLARFAEESGGAYFSPAESGLGPVFGKLRARIDGTWVLGTDVSRIIPEGQDLQVEVGFVHEGRFLADAFPVRLLPPVLSSSAAVHAGHQDPFAAPFPSAPVLAAVSPDLEGVQEPVPADRGAERAEKGLAVEIPSLSESDPANEDPAGRCRRTWLFLSAAAVLALLILGLFARRVGTGQKNHVSSVEESPRPVSAPEGVKLRLEAFRGPQVVCSFRLLLTGNLTLGRASDSDIAIPGDPAVSGRHCELVFQRESGAAAVRDLGSTNGTFVNNLRIDSLTPLGDGDMLRVGRTSLRVVYEGGFVPPEGGH